METRIYKQKKYCAIFFHPEGNWVSDFSSDDKKEIWDKIANVGSRWIFHPIGMITTGKTIVDTTVSFGFLKGKSIKKVSQFFKAEWDERADEICEAFNNGFGELIY